MDSDRFINTYSLWKEGVSCHRGTMNQKFNSSTTPSMVLAGKDLTGKVAIVTGGNCGIGYETVKALAFHGAKVYAACRDLDRANTAIDVLRAEKPTAQIIVMKCDLSSLDSVKQFAKDFIQKEEKLHMLICNAGIMAAPHAITEDGFEQTFQINYLAHIYLIHLLRDALIASAPSRIILVSSEIHQASSISRDNISAEYLSPSSPKLFLNLMAYNNSKLCMNLATRRLADMYRDSNVSVHCLHPGGVDTNLFRHRYILQFMGFLGKYFIKTAEQGAATSVYCATAEGLENKSGAYYNNCAECRQSSKADDEQLVDALWKITQEMLSNRI
ncbi:WW domain-containing oxidoreductase-like [Brevipalpus obovatus]|uniref:WW domain-containing oxidoreductase-like n=1 Tax=Brevipalpus obovatus TaxID=246614 RepID=UPI003D9DDEB0